MQSWHCPVTELLHKPQFEHHHTNLYYTCWGKKKTTLEHILRPDILKFIISTAAFCIQYIQNQIFWAKFCVTAHSFSVCFAHFGTCSTGIVCCYCNSLTLLHVYAYLPTKANYGLSVQDARQRASKDLKYKCVNKCYAVSNEDSIQML